MQQQTLTGFENYSKTTRRAQFLTEMGRVAPWAKLGAVIEPFYPKSSPEGDRQPLPLERMLRVYFLQQTGRLWMTQTDQGASSVLNSS